MLCKSLPIDSVRPCIKYAIIKVFSEPNFPMYGQTPRTYSKHMYQTKPVYTHFLPSLTYFTDYPRKLYIIEKDQ